MLEIGIDWPGKFTQGKPRGHWTRVARARDRVLHTRGAGRQRHKHWSPRPQQPQYAASSLPLGWLQIGEHFTNPGV